MQGDSFLFAFPQAADAVVAAAATQRAARRARPRSTCRMGIHTGEPVLNGSLYAGLDVHRAARTMSAAHGDQVLISETTGALVAGKLPGGLQLHDLGEHRLKDLSAPQRLYQLAAGVFRRDFAPLMTLRPTNLPVPPTPFLGRERELAEVSALLRTSRRAAAHADRAGRHRKDSPRSPGGGRCGRAVRRRRLLGRTSALAGPDPRDGRDRPDAGGERRSRRSYRLEAAAGAARQLRAGRRRCAGARPAARELPEPRSARHEPRAASSLGGARVCRLGDAGGRRRRALPGACTGD